MVKVQRRKTARVQFDRGYPARIMGIDGTWSRDCRIEDISATGARLAVEGEVAGLNLGEFFLALSRMGDAHRRCAQVWLTGDTLGVRFLEPEPMVGRDARRGSRPASGA